MRRPNLRYKHHLPKSPMELTKEYFDAVISTLTTKDDLTKVVLPLATKQDVRGAVEELARLVSAESNRTANLRLFERKFQKLEEALHVTL
jgi:hypothetical protein